MKTKFKTMVLCTLTMMTMKTYAQGGATGIGGGGNGPEIRVNEIRADILSWIKVGGAKGLNLPVGMSHKHYEEQMKSVLEPQKVIVTFIEKDHERDEDLQVQVDHRPKTCRGFILKKGLIFKKKQMHILCNTKKFNQTSESVQYRLIHHEYAGLAGLERNDGAASDYEISDQLTDYLKPTTVLRLALKKTPRIISCGTTGSIEKRTADCSVKKGNFNLVTKTSEGHEVWKDNESGSIWTDEISAPQLDERGHSIFMTYFQALARCSKNGLPEMGGISAKWGLPDQKDYETAYANGIFELSNPGNYEYWINRKGCESRDCNSIFVFARNNHPEIRWDQDDPSKLPEDREDERVYVTGAFTIRDIRTENYTARCVADGQTE